MHLLSVYLDDESLERRKHLCNVLSLFIQENEFSNTVLVGTLTEFKRTNYTVTNSTIYLIVTSDDKCILKLFFLKQSDWTTFTSRCRHICQNTTFPTYNRCLSNARKLLLFIMPRISRSQQTKKITRITTWHYKIGSTLSSKIGKYFC